MVATTRTERSLSAAAEDAVGRFAAANPRSHEAFEAGTAHMPGADTRSVLHYAPFPVTIVGGDGATLEDLDGHTYTDFLGDYTAGLHGHSNPRIRAALHETIDNGLRLGGPHPSMHELASLMCERFPAVERVRFTNSGTEANLMALSLARVATGRDAVLVCDGGYHGGVLDFASVDRRLNVPFPWVTTPYNDPYAARDCITENASRLAAVLVEPMLGGGGAIPGDPQFLAALRDETARYEIPLVFDEVITSRLAPGGLHGELGIAPDLVTFGKYLGGGASFGAFGGRADLMALFDPRLPGALHHAGTSNNNVLSMSAGLAGLRDVYTGPAVLELNNRGDRFQSHLQGVADERGAPVRVTGRGSVLNVHFQRQEIVCASDTAATSPEARTLFHMEMMLAGFYLAPRGLMSLSLAIDDSDCERFATEFGRFLDRHGRWLEDT
ncbi:MAG: aminotransferase class III-fold pyridoxal phosphate-dependent enzyme [Gemmatimonadota bacterium]|nr:aminotransferase class III-fold pyridoxal phosphate-dependent enzyme [Gemmatimonadota bacterium]